MMRTSSYKSSSRSANQGRSLLASHASRLQPLSGWIGERQTLDAVPDFGDGHSAQEQAARLVIGPRFDPIIAVRFAQLGNDAAGASRR
jgi:hypothetical protein